MSREISRDIRSGIAKYVSHNKVSELLITRRYTGTAPPAPVAAARTPTYYQTVLPASKLVFNCVTHS